MSIEKKKQLEKALIVARISFEEAAKHWDSIEFGSSGSRVESELERRAR